jgi:GNAT superfamily N-acetyltransferase
MVLSAENSTNVRPINQVEISPLDRADAGVVMDAVFAGLSPRSRYLRFHSPVPRLPSAVRARLADVDGRRHVAVVAHAGNGPIGIARAIGNGDGGAELAVEVVDAWHRRGVGTALLTALSELAEQHGHQELRGELLPENQAMQGLARKIAPWARMHYDGDVIQLTVPLGEAAWTITNEDVIADLVGRYHAAGAVRP